MEEAGPPPPPPLLLLLPVAGPDDEVAVVELRRVKLGGGALAREVYDESGADCDDAADADDNNDGP